VLKISDKAHILPLIPHRMTQKSNFVDDFANNAERYLKKYQASRSLFAIAELLVFSALTLLLWSSDL